MHIGNFSRRSLVLIKKWPGSISCKNSSSKDNDESCYKDLGEFSFRAQSYPDIPTPSDPCCPDGEKDVYFSPCQIIEQDSLTVCPSCEGRLLVLHVNLKNICPNKIVAVGVLIYENDRLYALKVKKIPTGSSSDCSNKNFYAGEFCFVIQEDHLGERRDFKAKVISHYVRF